MVQTISTMVSLMLGLGAGSVIAAAIADDWVALRRALRPAIAGGVPPLPPRTHRVTPAPTARMIRVSPAPAPLRAAA